MQLSLYSWNGTQINDTTNYVSWIPQGQQVVPVGSPIYTPRYATFPMLSGSVLSEVYFTIIVQPSTTFHSARQTVKRLFDTADQTPRTLIAKDTADSNRQWYIKAIPRQVIEGSGDVGRLTVTLATYEPYWRVVTPSTDTKSITATGQTKALTVLGSTYARPVITLTLTSVKTNGYQYQHWVAVKNVIARAFNDFPIDLTFGGWDTTALVSDTTISNQINQVGGIDAVVTTIPIDTPVGGGLPTAGMGYVGTEQISWTGNSAGNLTGVTRGLGGTTAAIHADNAVISRSKMLANGDDLRVFNHGQEIYRWFGGGGINSATTRIWANIDLSPAAKPTLLGSHTNVVTTLTFKQTSANLTALTTLATAHNKVLYVGTEAITFTAINLTTYQATGCTRGAKNTTNAAHSDGDVCYWIENDIWITHGNASETAPDVDDNYKPMIDLTNSTNTLWKWTDYNLYRGSQTAQWRPHLKSHLGPESDYYTANHQTYVDLETPAAEMGMSIAAFKRSNVWKAETAMIYWEFFAPCGMTTVNVTGEKYRGSTGWPALAGLQKSTDGVKWTTVWTEVTPASVTTWTAVANTGDKALTTTQYFIRFILFGSINAVADNVADLEIDAVAVTLDSNKVPVGVFGAEITNRYLMDCTLTNTTSGDILKFRYPGYLNKAFTLDCNLKTLTWFDGSTIPVTILNVDPYNVDWLRLTPGSNTIQYDETNVAGVDLAFSWEDREFL